MKIKTTKTVEATFTIDDLKEILAEKLEKPKEDINIYPIMEQEYWQIDNLESESYDVFAGIKITYKE